MNLTAPSPDLSRELGIQMQRRAAELRMLLQAANGAAMDGDATGDVLDFKDVAAEDARALVDEVAHAHAAAELRGIAAAMRRLASGTYGQCEDCGEPVDERRLRALPATRYCTACQAIHERPPLQRR